VLQLIMVAVVIMYPGLVTGSIEKAQKVDESQVTDMLLDMAPAGEAAEEEGTEPEASGDAAPAEEGAQPAPSEGEEPDPMKALMDDMKKPSK